MDMYATHTQRENESFYELWISHSHQTTLTKNSIQFSFQPHVTQAADHLYHPLLQDSLLYSDVLVLYHRCVFVFNEKNRSLIITIHIEIDFFRLKFRDL